MTLRCAGTARWLGLPFLLFLMAWAEEPTPDEEAEAIAYTLELDPLEFQRVDPDAAFLARVAAATGARLDALRGLPVFVGNVDSEKGERRVRLVRVPLSKAGDAKAALLALGEDLDFLAAAVVDDFGAPIGDWENLLGSLRHYRIPQLESAQPRQHLERVRKLWQQGEETREARLGLALLELLGHMNQQASAFNIPEAMLASSPLEMAEMMTRQYEHVSSLIDDLAPLLGSERSEFERLADLSRSSAAAVAEALRNEDQARASKSSRQMMANCSACHRLPLSAHGGRFLTDVFTAEREKRGIGDGFWQVGHDVRVHHPDRQKLQHVVDALRAGALLLQTGL